MGETQPRSTGIDLVRDAPVLLEGRYGTREQCDIWGTDANTHNAIVDVQVRGYDVLNSLHPGNVPDEYVDALKQAAMLIDSNKIRAAEARGGHDVVAINKEWGQVADSIVPNSSSIVNLMRTSADSTETAKAYRCKLSMEVLAASLENLRDIILEKSTEWIDDPFMDQTHLYDALPTVAGRPFSFFAEMLQSDLNVISFFYTNSLVGKWADATGNHHSAVSRGIDGMALQEAYARHLGLRCMTAPAQTPGREFNADIMYSLARTAGTLANLGRYIRRGRGDDSNVFIYDSPKKKKGSSAMPHKDIKNGNPTSEEQAESGLHEMAGKMVTAIETIVFDYGRDLGGSASDRLDVGPGFKLVDHITRKLADLTYYLTLNQGRSMDRINRTYGTVTSEQIMTYLVDPTRSSSPMTRDDAHNLAADLAKKAYTERRPFFDVLKENQAISERIDGTTLQRVTDPLSYIGQSREIIKANYDVLHGKKTFTHATL